MACPSPSCNTQIIIIIITIIVIIVEGFVHPLTHEVLLNVWLGLAVHPWHVLLLPAIHTIIIIIITIIVIIVEGFVHPLTHEVLLNVWLGLAVHACHVLGLFPDTHNIISALLYITQNMFTMYSLSQQGIF